MRRHNVLLGIALAAILAPAGCKSHQSKIDALQQEHDQLSRQYQKDCGSEYLNANPQFSEKCKNEAKQMDDVWKRLQAERAKD
jgi:hypothetical protein